MEATGSQVAVLREDTCRNCGQCRATFCHRSEPACGAASTTCSGLLWKCEKQGAEDKAAGEEEEEETRLSECGKLEGKASHCGEANGGGSGSREEDGGLMFGGRVRREREEGEEEEEEATDPREQQQRRQGQGEFSAVVMNGYVGEGDDDEDVEDEEEEEEGIAGVDNGNGAGIFTPRFRRRAEEAGWDENTLLMGIGALDEITEVGEGSLFPTTVPVSAVGGEVIEGREDWRRENAVVSPVARRNNRAMLRANNRGGDVVVDDDGDGRRHGVSSVVEEAVGARQSPRAMGGFPEDASAAENGVLNGRERDRKREVRTPGLARTPASAERRYRRLRHTSDLNENEGIRSTSSEALRRIREGADAEPCLQRSSRELGRRLEAIQASRRIVLEKAEERNGVSSSSLGVRTSLPSELQASSPTSGGEGGKNGEKECGTSEKDRKQGITDRIAEPGDRTCELACLEQLRQELSCAVCLEICVEPSTTTCGHSFCSSCLRSSIQRCGPKCPKCRHPLGADAALHCPVNTVLWNTIQLLFPEVVAEMVPKKRMTVTTNRGNQLSSLVIPGPHPLMQMLSSNGRGRQHTRGLARIATHLVTGEDHAVHTHFVHNTPRLRSSARAPPPNNPFREPRPVASASMPSTLVTSDSHRPALHSVSLRRASSSIGPIPSSVVGNTRVVPDRTIEEDDESEGDEMDLFSGTGRLTETNAEIHNPMRARYQAYMLRARRNERDDRSDRPDRPDRSDMERLESLLLATRLPRPEIVRDDDSPPSPSLSSPSSLPQVLITSASAAAASNQLASARSDSTRSAMTSRSATSSRSAQTPQLRHARHL